ncbi:MAG: DNA topoisomerase IV subunit B, partial [Mycoplasmatales bacterium]
KKYYIQRYKGLGEMDANQLWETTMDPNKRQLIQVSIEDIINAEKQVSTLMGDDVSKRREWIETFVDFEESDTFEI